jgi:hypothetical protein
MDSWASGGVGASIVLALGVIYKIYIAINHHRVVSNCCGKKIEVSLDVDETTPKSRDAQVDKCDQKPEERKEIQSNVPDGERKNEEY